MKLISENVIFFIELAGVQYYRRNGDFKFKIGDNVFIFKEPDNESDPHAIKVVNRDGEIIGHIPKGYTQEINEGIDNGFNFNVVIDIVNLAEKLHPFVMMQMVMFKNEDICKLTNNELPTLERKSRELKLKQIENENKARELTLSGKQAETIKDYESAIEIYEKSIDLFDFQPIAYERLAIIYRKKKDFDSEIRILTRWIQFCKNSIFNKDVINSEIKAAKERISKCKELKIRFNQKNK